MAYNILGCPTEGKRDGGTRISCSMRGMMLFQSEDEKDLTKSMQDLTIGNCQRLLHILNTRLKKNNFSL